MKLFVKFNRPVPGSKCSEHKTVPAVYEIEAKIFGQAVRMNACAGCVCRHFNFQVHFTVEEGMELPRGLRHRRSFQ